MENYLLPGIGCLFIVLSAVFGLRSGQLEGNGDITLRVRRKISLIFGIAGIGLILLHVVT
jgi:hypothetical protein